MKEPPEPNSPEAMRLIIALAKMTTRVGRMETSDGLFRAIEQKYASEMFGEVQDAYIAWSKTWDSAS